MLDVLKSRWQSKGWHPMAKEDSEPMAMEFIRELNRHGVPWRCYRELYQRAVDLRARRLEMGMACDEFSVEMMVACWPSLQSEIKQREIDEGRTLPSTAQSQCPRCDGLAAGLENLFDDDGNRIGVRKGCDHRPVEEGEGIWKHMQKAQGHAENAGPSGGLTARE